MINLYVKLNENGYVSEYQWNDKRKSLDWLKTNHDGNYIVDVSIFAKKLVDGVLVLDEEEFKRQEEERNKPQPTPEPSQLDLIQKAVEKSHDEIREEYTLELINSGVIQ